MFHFTSYALVSILVLNNHSSSGSWINGIIYTTRFPSFSQQIFLKLTEAFDKYPKITCLSENVTPPIKLGQSSISTDDFLASDIKKEWILAVS